jgi:type I restriction enzyme S subunit
MKNWVEKKLDEVCELITCGVAAKPQYVSEGIPFLSAKNVKEGQIVWSGYNCVTEKTHKELTKNNKPLVGDILYTRVGSYGEAAVIEDDIEFSVFVSLTLIKVDKSVLNNYFLKHYLNSDFVKRLAKKSISGSGVGNLNVGTVRDFPILLPPLAEQKRIVAILDEAFAAIAKAKANAEQNLKNAKELFESYLHGVFERKGDGWEEKSLGDLADEKCTLSYGIVQPGDEYENGLPVIRPTDLTSRFIGLSGLKRIDPKLADGYKRTKLIGDELLLCVRGTTGVVSIATKELKDANVTRGIVPIRFNTKIINQEYGYYLLVSNYIQKQIRAKTYGAALMQINIGDLRKINSPYPSLKAQQNIVQKLDALSAETKKLEAIYQQKINDLEELKKSILQKAFSGELKTGKVLV